MTSPNASDSTVARCAEHMHVGSKEWMATFPLTFSFFYEPARREFERVGGVAGESPYPLIFSHTYEHRWEPIADEL